MKRLIGGLFFFLMAGYVAAQPIPGDVNGDGRVDFQDFLILAQNFGKTGDPPLPDTLRVTVYDTVKTSVHDTSRVTIFLSEARQPVSEQEIPGLTVISVSGLWRNWDADIEDDGIAVSITLRDALGGLIFSSQLPGNIPLTVDVKLYTDNDRNDQPDLPPVYSGQFIGTVADFLQASISMARIPKEQIAVDPLKDRQFGIMDVTVTTPLQGSFSARSTFTTLYP